MLTQSWSIAITGPVCTLQYEAYTLNQAASVLKHVERVTSIEPLRMQLIQALMAYLEHAFQLFKTDTDVRQDSNQASINICRHFLYVDVYNLTSALCTL